MHVNLHELKKKLPDAAAVQKLIVDKKKVHRKVIHGVEAANVSISSDLKNLHYSAAGPTPRESELGS
mgnify:CR=1 FL=1